MKTTEEYMKLPYTLTVRWSADDELFVARVKEIEGCTGHGGSEAEAIAMLRDNMREWISFCLEAGDEIPLPADPDRLPSGKWLQRVPRSLHKRLVECAENEGVSLNTFVTACLARAVGRADAKDRAPVSATVATMHAASPTLLLGQGEPSFPIYGGRALAGFQCITENDDWCIGGWKMEPVKTGIVVANPNTPYQEVLLEAVASQLANHWIWKGERADRDEEEGYRKAEPQRRRAYA
jgi:predicted HicB family RNase H-like nuclease